MWTVVALFLIFRCSFCFGRSAEECNSLLTQSGASAKFGGSVAHGIHSMTVSELKKFYPAATEENCVPTVNHDLNADQAILMYAPEIKSPLDQSLYDTEGMKTVDMVLSRMDNKFWGIKNYSPLEKLVHAFHMKEVWAKTLKQFKKIERNPPSDEACQCALDVGNNGIMNIMKYLALVIREPSLVQGNPAYKDFNWDANVYSFKFYDVKLRNGTVDYAAEAQDPGMPHLTDEISWMNWRNKLPPEEQNYDTALFLYCAAKKANGIESSMTDDNIGSSLKEDKNPSWQETIWLKRSRTNFRRDE